MYYNYHPSIKIVNKLSKSVLNEIAMALHDHINAAEYKRQERIASSFVDGLGFTLDDLASYVNSMTILVSIDQDVISAREISNCHEDFVSSIEWELRNIDRMIGHNFSDKSLQSVNIAMLSFLGETEKALSWLEYYGSEDRMIEDMKQSLNEMDNALSSQGLSRTDYKYFMEYVRKQEKNMEYTEISDDEHTL